MNKLTSTLVLAAISAAIATASAAASPTTNVLIRHQTVGCHSWSVNGDAFAASQRIVVRPKTTFSFTNTDVMPHQLIQLSGPKVSLATPAMNKPGARASVHLLKKGTYVFGTKAGEDWIKGVVTKGEDNVLKLTVVVR
jgi:plastocyanin